MNMKILVVAFTMLVMMLSIGAVVSAANVPLEIEYVEINGDKYTSENLVIADHFERGEELDITVKYTGLEEVNNAQIEAYISGYKYSQYEGNLVSDVSRPFDLEADTSDKLDFKLQIPMKMDMKDTKLRIRVSNENDDSFELVYQLRIRGVDEENAIQVKDFTVSPSDVVVAGRPLSFKVKVKNYGDDDLDDVYVKVSIPELGISDDETLDQIDSDESETFEELLLRIPVCTQPGTYLAEAVVDFDEFEETVETMTITVLESDSCEVGSSSSSESKKPATSKTVITVPDSQNVVLGTTGAVYPIMISNLGSSPKTYTISASGFDLWGTVRLDPSAVVVVQPESVKTVYLYVAAKDETAVGAQVFKVGVSSDDETKQVVLSAIVKEADNDNVSSVSYDGLKRGLEVGLIILVIILIILGLIIGFNKLKGGQSDEDDDESQTYY